jgi:hypothetical protein
MGLYQCRGYVRSISSDGNALFIGIGANTKFDCKKNKLKKKHPGAFDSTVYNIFMEVKLTPRAVYLQKDVSVIALPEDHQIPVKKETSAELNSFIESAYETESTFIIEGTSSGGYELIYMQVGPENNDE